MCRVLEVALHLYLVTDVWSRRIVVAAVSAPFANASPYTVCPASSSLKRRSRCGSQAFVTIRRGRASMPAFGDSRSGNAGDMKPVGSGVSELRIDCGPGYRVYYLHRGSVLAVLLCGGDKRTQDADIKRAVTIAKDWKR
jgi:putative addiction module killer protein